MAYDTYRSSYRRSIPDIFGDVLNHVASLVRTEGQLARAELSEKVNEASIGLALVVGGAVLLIPALVILLGAAVTALASTGISTSLAALIVGGAALVVGLILLAIGASRLRGEALAPHRTIRQLQGTAQLAKQQVRSDSDLQRAA